MPCNRATSSPEEYISDLELALEFSESGLHLLDQDGTTILMNRFCEEREELCYADIKGKTMQQLQDEGVLSRSVTVQVLKTGKSVTLMQTGRSGREMLVTGTPIFDEDGTIYRVMVTSRDISELNRLKKQLAEAQTLYQETQSKLMEIRSYQDIPTDIICRSPAMRKILHLAMLVANVDSNILVTGESGTGKGVICRFIHDRSARRDKPFIKIDCGSIPESLFESELFGYEKGSFTGANQSGKRGLMELANGGTLFLDEIGELPLSCQAKLLRAIQDREFLRVGGSQLVHVDVRILAATNRDLRAMVREKRFREDLFYRICVVPVPMPSLKERREDIPALIHRFSQVLCDKYGFSRKFTMDAIDILSELPWPGNIREVENFVEMMLITTEKPLITAEDLPAHVREQNFIQEIQQVRGNSLSQRMDAYERYILADLLRRGLSPGEIARELQLDVTTVRRKLEKHDLPRRKNAGLH